ncbi:MAG: TIGR03773 family transporter-associated surface protein [Buchananella hordeovulneris]|nr:TIGR03773 family transporter-associated surface protein [Buchananella hordeovulneris]
MPRKELAVLLTAGAVALSGLNSVFAPLTALAEPDNARTVISAGHVDVASLVENGQLVTKLKDSTVQSGYVMRELSDVVLHVLPAAQRTLPDGFEFIAAAGQGVWLLPETSVTHIVWPGWSTEHIPVGMVPAGVEWTLDKVEGPGDVAVFQSDIIEGTTILWNSRDGVDAADSFHIGQDKHVHGAWVFTAAGGYCLTATRSAQVQGVEQQVTSRIAFAVGDVDPLSVQCEPAEAPTPIPSQAAPSGEPTPTSEPGDEPSLAPSAGGTTLPPAPPAASPTPSAPAPSGEPTGAPTGAPTPRGSASASASASPAPSISAPTPPPGPSPSASARPSQPAPGNWRVPNRHVNAAGAVVLNDGHIDVASTLENGRLLTWIKDTTTGGEPIWRDPAKTILQALPASKTVLPKHPKWSFIGAAGTPVYLLPQKQRDGILWPGWSTEHIDSAATTGGVGWKLISATGPGHVSIFDTDTFGNPRIYFATANGVGPEDYAVIPKRTHAHGSWAFTAPGVYCLGMQRAAELPSGTTVSSNFTLALAVGEADVSRLDPAVCAPQVNKPGVVPPPVAPPREKPAPAAAAPSAAASTAPCETRLPVLEAGHIDYATRLVGGGIQSLIGDDTGGPKVYREPAGTILWLKPGSEVTLPAGFGAVGTPGSTVWQVPQTQAPGLIWLGWSTEALTSANARGSVSWTINSIEGPGAVRVYLSGAFGGVQEIVFNNGGTYQIPLGVHAHANWIFTASGVYKINSTQSVQLANGVHASDTETLTIAVGDVDIAKVATTSNCTAPVSAVAAGDTAAATWKSATQARATAASAGVLRALAVPAKPAARQEAAAAAAVAPVAAPAVDPRVVPLLALLGALLALGAAGLGFLRWRA